LTPIHARVPQDVTVAVMRHLIAGKPGGWEQVLEELGFHEEELLEGFRLILHALKEEYVRRGGDRSELERVPA